MCVCALIKRRRRKLHNWIRKIQYHQCTWLQSSHRINLFANWLRFLATMSHFCHKWNWYGMSHRGAKNARKRCRVSQSVSEVMEVKKVESKKQERGRVRIDGWGKCEWRSEWLREEVKGSGTKRERERECSEGSSNEPPSSAYNLFTFGYSKRPRWYRKFVLVWCTNPFDVVYVLFMSLACSKWILLLSQQCQ